MLEGRQVGPVEMLSWKKETHFLVQTNDVLTYVFHFGSDYTLKIYEDTVCTFVLCQKTNSDF